MELATFIGISITEFWDITPAELNIAQGSYEKRKNLEAEEYAYKFEAMQKAQIYQAYLTSRWVWQKRVNIEKVLSKKKQEQMTDEQMLAQVKNLNRLFGGEEISGRK